MFQGLLHMNTYFDGVLLCIILILRAKTMEWIVLYLLDL
jgi:hypothetical protein